MYVRGEKLCVLGYDPYTYALNFAGKDISALKFNSIRMKRIGMTWKLLETEYSCYFVE